MKKNSIQKLSLLLLTLAISISFAIAQKKVERLTPYDYLPSAHQTIKPEYREDMPDWGKMLYQYPVNFHEVVKAYTKWEEAEKRRTNMNKVRNPLIKYYRIWNKSVEPYVLTDGTIDLPDIDAIYSNLYKIQMKSSKGIKRAPQQGNTSEWSFVGPKKTVWHDNPNVEAPWQANVYSIDYSLNNLETLYIGTETGYVNKTTNNGTTWHQCGRDYVFGGAVTAVAAHNENTNIAYAAAGGTVHKTEDGGQTWTPTTARNSFNTNRMRMSEVDSDFLIVASSTGVRYTKDGGDSWKRGGGATTDCWDVQFKPNTTDTIYSLNRKANNSYNVLRSTNGGSRFYSLNFPEEIKQHSGGLLAVSPADPDALYVFVLSENENKRPYIYKGEPDAGDNWTWTQVYKGSDGGFTSGILNNGQGYFDIVFAVSPINKNVIFAGTTSLFKSTNAGKSFSAIGGYAGSYSIHPDIQEIKFLPDGGIWVTTDGGVNFSADGFVRPNQYRASVDGIVGSDFWGFDQGWNEDILVGGRYHNGNTVITDFYGHDNAVRMGGGESPTGWVLQGKSRHVAFDDIGDGYILPKKLGQPWEGRFLFTKHPNMDGYGANRSNVATHPYYSGTLYVGSDNSVWVSTDYGASYELLYTFPGRVRYLNVALSNPDVMYVDVVGQGLYKTEDGGENWTRKTQPTSWGGIITFAISPYNSDYVYAAPQTGGQNGDVYRTKDGGNTWEKWSNFNKTTKSIAIQPTKAGKDLVYLFTTSTGGNQAEVFIRKDGDADWTEFDTGYPHGLRVNLALPFYRDSKIRVSGNSGVWESPLAEPDFTPIIIPWVAQKVYDCKDEVIQLDSHSLLNQEGVTWEWEIHPAPKSISSTSIRNPRVKVAEPGKYTVTLTVTKDGQTYSKTVKDLFEVKECPSIYTCDNPGRLPQKEWKLISVDSQQGGNPGSYAFDGNASTIWHTQWSPSSPAHPHNIQINLGEEYNVSSMIYQGRSDGENGRIKDYELYLSMDNKNWGEAIATGQFENNSGEQKITFEPVKAQYAKLVALSEVNGENWTSIAELNFIGCLADGTGVQSIDMPSLRTFPVPATSVVNIELPFQDGINEYNYTVYNAAGSIMEYGFADSSHTHIEINLSSYASGNYFVRIQDKNGLVYRVKFLK